MRPITRCAIDASVLDPMSSDGRTDVHIAYQVLGDGPVDVVFCPEWFNNIDVWWDEPRIERFLHRLASFSRLILFDKRGTGVSDPVPLDRDPVLEIWMDDISRVMDHVGSKQATLFGHSGGAQISLLFAATYPERTASLVLSNAWASLADAPDYWRDMKLMERWHPDRMGRFMWGADPELWGLFSEAGLVPAGPQDEAFHEWFARYGRLSIAYGPAQALSERLYEIDLRPILSAVIAPTLVLSRRDHFLTSRPSRMLADELPNAKYVELPGADHLFFLGDTTSLLDEVELFVTGELPQAEPDRVLATLMFTDIVSSTERAAAMGDRRWRDVLSMHDSIVDRELGRFGGRRVKHTGDGILAIFDGPGRAVRCARGIAQAVRTVGIEIRAGLHTGEVEIRDEDVGGLAVNIAKRINDIAKPNEVLVSSTVRDIVIGSQLEFADRGERRLRGVPDPWRLYAVGP